MKKFLQRTLAVFLLLGATAGLGAYFLFPSVLLQGLKWQQERSSKVTEKFLRVEGYQASYYEGGKGEPLVLLHGFGGSKLSFLRSVRWLTPHFRVVLPDLPGFGESQRDPVRIHSIRGQVEFLAKFLKQLGIRSLFLGGNSMGGHISAAYARMFPKQVKKLLLLNASGLRTQGAPLPYQSPEKPIQTRAELYQHLQKTFYKAPRIPAPLEGYLLQRMKQNFHWSLRLRSEIRRGRDYILNGGLSRLSMPTLLLWGDSDRLLSPTVGSQYRKEIPHATWVMMKHCGHSPQYERPRETAEILLRFLLKK